MKSAFLALAFFVPFSVFANVVEIEDASAKNVIAVYEEMREEQQDVGSSDKSWVHDFEDAGVGSEMDHLSRLKRTTVASEEM